MTESLRKSLEETLSHHTGEIVVIKSANNIGGGCINQAQKLETSAGVFFVKMNDAARYSGMFEAEAKGLNALRAANAIRVPSVIAFGESGTDSFLLLEFIHSGARSKKFWENFGQALASLHKHSSGQFGLDHDNYIGSLPQSNRKHSTWNSFFIEERLQRQLKLALDGGLLTKKHARQFESLYSRLEKLFPDEVPALLHGDLWSGNFMISDNGDACILDPAVFYGHREAEIAFTRLFGGYDAKFYDAYGEALPLQPGFENRMDVYNLYPLLVHVNLFGGGYGGSVESILTRVA